MRIRMGSTRSIRFRRWWGALVSGATKADDGCLREREKEDEWEKEEAGRGRKESGAVTWPGEMAARRRGAQRRRSPRSATGGVMVALPRSSSGSSRRRARAARGTDASVGRPRGPGRAAPGLGGSR